MRNTVPLLIKRQAIETPVILRILFAQQRIKLNGKRDKEVYDSQSLI